MFYKMIEQARDRWYASPDCTVTDLIGYMIQLPISEAAVLSGRI